MTLNQFVVMRRLLALVALSAVVGCSTKKPDANQLVEQKVVVDDPVEQNYLDQGLELVESGAYEESQVVLRKISRRAGTFGYDIAQIGIARAKLGSFDWLMLGTPPPIQSSDPQLREAFDILHEIVERPGVDPQVHYAARIYLAVVYLLADQRGEVDSLLSDYPSTSFGPAVVPSDRRPLLFLLANEFERGGRHLVATLAFAELFAMGVVPKAETGAAQTPEQTPGEGARRVRRISRGEERPEVLSGLSDLERLVVDSFARGLKKLLLAELARVSEETSATQLGDLVALEVLKREVETQSFALEQVEQTLKRLEPNVARLGYGAWIDDIYSRVHVASQADLGELQRVGVLLPSSGPYKNRAEATKRAILLTANQVAEDEPESRRVAFVFDDESTDPRTLAQRYAQLNVKAVIGPWRRKLVEPLYQRLEPLKIPIFSLAPTTTQTQSHADLVEMSYDPVEEARATAQVAATYLKDRRIVILHEPNGYGRTLAQVFSSTFMERGNGVILTETIDGKSSNYTELAKRVVAANPDAIYMPMSPQKAAQVASFLAQQNIWGTPAKQPSRTSKNGQRGVHYLGTSLWQNDRFINQAATYLNGALIPQWRDPGFETGKTAMRVGETFERESGDALDAMTAATIDATLFSIKLLSMRGLTQSLGETSTSSRSSILRGDPVEVQALSGKIKLDINGQLNRQLRFLEFKDRKWEPTSIEVNLRPPGGS